MQGSGRRARNRCLLLVIGKSLASKVCAPSLRDLDDDWGLDIPVAILEDEGDQSINRTDLAASNTAFTVEDDVQFY